MNNREVNILEAKQYLNKSFRDRGYSEMNDNEEYILRGIWEKQSYQQMHSYQENTNHPFSCNLNTLTKNNGPDFFTRLKVLLNDKNINKRNARKIIINAIENERLLNPDSHPRSNQGEETGSKGSDFSPETSPTRDTHFFQYAIALYVKNSDDITIENLSKKTRVTPEKPGSMNLFDLLDTPWGRNQNWYLKDIEEHLKQGNNSRWVDEIVNSFYSTLKGRLNNCGSQDQEVQSLLRTSKGKLYRSIFYKMESFEYDSVKLIIIFEEEFSWGYMTNPPNLSYSTLLTALNLGSRLQYEVCEKYLPMLPLWQKEGLSKIDIRLLEIQNTVDNIDKEAERRREGEANNTTNEDRLLNCFESEDEKDTIKNNMLRQEKYKQILRNANNMQDNVNQVIDALTNLSYLNSIVLDMVGKQFSKVLTQMREKNSR